MEIRVDTKGLNSATKPKIAAASSKLVTARSNLGGLAMPDNFSKASQLNNIQKRISEVEKNLAGIIGYINNKIEDFERIQNSINNVRELMYITEVGGRFEYKDGQLIDKNPGNPMPDINSPNPLNVRREYPNNSAYEQTGSKVTAGNKSDSEFSSNILNSPDFQFYYSQQSLYSENKVKGNKRNKKNSQMPYNIQNSPEYQYYYSWEAKYKETASIINSGNVTTPLYKQWWEDIKNFKPEDFAISLGRSAVRMGENVRDAMETYGMSGTERLAKDMANDEIAKAMWQAQTNPNIDVEKVKKEQEEKLKTIENIRKNVMDYVVRDRATEIMGDRGKQYDPFTGTLVSGTVMALSRTISSSSSRYNNVWSNCRRNFKTKTINVIDWIRDEKK